eukprot:1961793-Prymnesium_polylepis.1
MVVATAAVTWSTGTPSEVEAAAGEVSAWRSVAAASCAPVCDAISALASTRVLPDATSRVT